MRNVRWALATAVAVVVAVSGCDQDDTDLAEAMSGNVPAGDAVGCTLQDGETWYYCGASSDPGSGFHRHFRVEVTDDCWTAQPVSFRPGGGFKLGAQTYEGCFDDPNDGLAIAGPGQAPEPQ